MTDLEGLQQALLEELGRLPNAEQFILGGGVALNELLPLGHPVGTALVMIAR